MLDHLYQPPRSEYTVHAPWITLDLTIKVAVPHELAILVTVQHRASQFIGPSISRLLELPLASLHHRPGHPVPSTARDHIRV
jgi:hypothetical protein